MDMRLSQLEKFQVLDHLSGQLPFTSVEATTSSNFGTLTVYGKPSCDIHDSSELVICMLHDIFLGMLITMKQKEFSLDTNTKYKNCGYILNFLFNYFVPDLYMLQNIYFQNDCISIMQLMRYFYIIIVYCASYL